MAELSRVPTTQAKREPERAPVAQAPVAAKTEIPFPIERDEARRDTAVQAKIVQARDSQAASPSDVKARSADRSAGMER